MIKLKLKPTSNYESTGDLGRWLFDKNPTAFPEVGGRVSDLSYHMKHNLKPTSNYESTGDLGRWLFDKNPPASLEVGGRASGLSIYNASETEAKIERMRIIRPRDALARSRYVQTTRVCETSITAPGVPGGTGPEHD